MPAGKRRIPGGSGGSNPSIHRHRQNAQKLGGVVRVKNSQLTTAALTRHDARQQEEVEAAAAITPDMPGALLDGTQQQLGGAGRDMFAAVRRMRNSPLEAHTEACAVLEAVTEMIQESGAEETSTAYWGALVSNAHTG